MVADRLSAGLSACGEGAAVLTQKPEGAVSGTQKKEGREVLPSLPPSRTAGTVTVQETLLVLGVYTLDRTRRAALADRLQSLGIGSADLLELRDYLLGCVSDPQHARRVVVGKVIDVATLPEAIEDLRRHRELSAAQAAPTRSTSHYWGFPSPHPSCACEGCEGRRRMGYAEMRS